MQTVRILAVAAALGLTGIASAASHKEEKHFVSREEAAKHCDKAKVIAVAGGKYSCGPMEKMDHSKPM